jgi:hypothetical protein
LLAAAAAEITPKLQVCRRGLGAVQLCDLPLARLNYGISYINLGLTRGNSPSRVLYFSLSQTSDPQ